MKALIVVFFIFICSCCPCKKIEIDYFDEDKNRYREEFRKGTISECEYYELMLGAYQLEENRKYFKK